jgi:hypothetical protein
MKLLIMQWEDTNSRYSGILDGITYIRLERLKETTKISIKTAGDLAENEIEYLPNSSVELYRYINLLSLHN